MAATSPWASGQDHESLRCEQGRSEIGVDGGFETLSFDGDFARFVLEEIERSVAHHGKVDAGVILAGSAFVFTEGHVELPMQIVLDAPVRAAGIEENRRIGRQRRDIEPRLP